jgi:riboflavin biosynthesis pyrimidine reductase
MAGMTVERIGTAHPVWYGWGVRADTSPVIRPPDQGVEELPDRPDREDQLAGLYAWPAESERATVRANMITSLDGGAAIDGRSGGLGNEADRHLFAVLRDLADVVLVGSGTVRAEQYAGIRLDPRRQARRQRWGRSEQPPPIAVVTGRGLDAHLPLFTDFQTRPIVITPRAAAGKVPKVAESLIAGEEEIDLPAALHGLAERGYRRIHCEGGPSLLGQLIANGLLDECCLTIAPLFIGSGATRLLPTDLADPATWALTGLRIAGAHLFARYRRGPA